ncbi:MAG: RDD family protein [Archangium sp.]
MQVDEQGRFVRELNEGSIFARFFAKAIDLALTSLLGALVGFISGNAITAALGPAFFLLSDSIASPGKWLLRLEAVTLAGKRLGLFASLSRNATLGLPPLAAVLLGAHVFTNTLDPRAEWGIVGCLWVLFIAVESMSLLLAPQDRRWSDQFSRTRVVQR